MDLVKNKHILQIKTILKEVGEKVEGNLVCERTPDNIIIKKFIDKINNLRVLCRGKKKICEIGVNACHSLLIMLMENPDAEYLLFDLKGHRYTEPCLNYVRSQFPNTKITVVFGDSTKTMAEYVDENKDELATYDLIHLDGGHTEPVFSKDYLHSKMLVKEDGIVIFDDYNMDSIKRYIDRKVKGNEIVEYKEDGLKKTKYHFVYKYVL